MAFIGFTKPRTERASDIQKAVVVTAVCALASLPLALCFALTVWGA